MQARAYNNLIIAATIGLFAFPVLLDFLFNGWTRIFTYFAGDAFYYLTVARNFASEGFFTFDQQFPTNGFHPMWQIVLGFLYRLALAIAMQKPGILVGVMLVNVAAISASILFLGKALLSELKQLPIIFLFLPVGIFALFDLPIDRLTSSLWGNVNGMESSLVILGYAILVWVMVQPSFLRTVASALLTGLLLSFIFLARLDHGFLVIAFFVVLGIQTIVNREWRNILFLTIIGLVVSGILTAYLLANYWSVGAFLPVSGGLKSSYPYVLNDKIPVIISILTQPELHASDGIPLLVRFSKLAFPVLPALGLLIWSAFRLWKGKLTRLDSAFATTSLFVLLLALYNFRYVALWYQGDWYFPLSLLFMTLTVVYLWGRRAPNLTSTSQFSIKSGLAIVLTAGLVVLFFANVYWNKDSKSHFTNFFTSKVPQIREYYASQNPKLIEVDDGIIGYATDFPTMSWLGFTLDVEAVKAKMNGNLTL